MRSFMTSAVLLSACLVCSAEPAAVRDVRLRSGGSMRGTVQGMDDKGVTLELEEAPGSKVVIALDRIVPADVFDIAIATFNLKSCDDWLKVAKTAEARGLPGFAVEALMRAQKADPARKGEVQPLLDAAWAAFSKARLSEVDTWLQNGDLARARKLLSEFVRASEGLAVQKTFKDKLAEVDAADKDVRKNAEKVEAERAGVRKAEADLETIAQLIVRGQSGIEEGRRLADKTGKAIEAYESALGTLARAEKAARAYRPGKGVAADVQAGYSQEAERLAGAARSEMATAHIELGFAYVSRQSLSKATDHAGEAAALDPHNPGVSTLRIAIAEASSEERR